ncbi:DNA modification methylase [Galbitalea soli]|uniref:DNA modification methylase n=1 Tax=Galbitalea soli TaxID=1268042 RepID=A0A7C9PPE5_9MICO|nr:DNA modification methylase [Galbitalea soli]NEM92334.1 DNA modification methylase [Galbitalea soli]NYJ31709.1 hypothetical protein [Galbitalea soli]
MKARIAASALLVVGVSLLTAGCTFITPQATLNPYDASDGFSATVGDIEIRNAFAISPDSVDASLNGVFINTGDSPEVVNVQYTDNDSVPGTPVTKTISIPAGGTVSLGDPGVPQLVLTGAHVEAGALLKLFVQYGDQSGKKIEVPVLDGTEPYYSHLTPTPTPTPVPTTAAPTPKPTDTAKPANN